MANRAEKSILSASMRKKNIETREIPIKMNSTIVNVKYEGDLLTCCLSFAGFRFLSCKCSMPARSKKSGETGWKIE